MPLFLIFFSRFFNLFFCAVLKIIRVEIMLLWLILFCFIYWPILWVNSRRMFLWNGRRKSMLIFLSNLLFWMMLNSWFFYWLLIFSISLIIPFFHYKLSSLNWLIILLRAFCWSFFIILADVCYHVFLNFLFMILLQAISFAEL